MLNRRKFRFVAPDAIDEGRICNQIAVDFLSVTTQTPKAVPVMLENQNTALLEQACGLWQR